MKAQSIYILIFFSFLLTALSCTKDYTNPAALPLEEVFADARATTGAAVGLQRRYSVSRASSLYNLVTANGFVTRELIILNVGNTSEAQLNTGGNAVDGTNTILEGLWINSNKIIFDADQVIASAEKLSDKAYASGLIGYATIFKALSLGNMAMFWEKIPSGIGDNVTFIDRMEGFNMAITAIDKALAGITADPISTGFLTNIPPGIDIKNTLYALKARYSLFSGNYAQALASADSVDLTKRSTMNFDNANLNPIFETATASNNVYQPVDSTLGLPVGLQPDAGDKRVQFYTSINPTVAPRFRISGFAAGATTPWPLYTPGEMMLIKAEAYARQSPPDLTNALIELNKVVTKTAAQDPYGIGAGLPPIAGPLTQDQILELIYKHRQIELFMHGLRLEDMRRFGRPITERKRNFFPYPFRERDNNTNTPPDPAF
jgi:starch-binding outer membrane protein, SusD/RagB family